MQNPKLQAAGLHHTGTERRNHAFCLGIDPPPSSINTPSSFLPRHPRSLSFLFLEHKSGKRGIMKTSSSSFPSCSLKLKSSREECKRTASSSFSSSSSSSYSSSPSFLFLEMKRTERGKSEEVHHPSRSFLLGKEKGWRKGGKTEKSNSQKKEEKGR